MKIIRMTLWQRVFAGVFVSGFLLVIVLPFISINTSRWTIIDQALERIMPSVDIDGTALHLRINPWRNHIHIHGQQLDLSSANQGWTFTANEVSTSLRLLALLRNRVELNTLNVSDFSVTLDPSVMTKNVSNTSGNEPRASSAPWHTYLPAIDLENGTIYEVLPNADEGNKPLTVWHIDRIVFPEGLVGKTVVRLRGEKENPDDTSHIDLQINTNAEGKPDHISINAEMLVLADIQAYTAFLDSRLTFHELTEPITVNTNINDSAQGWLGTVKLDSDQFWVNAESTNEDPGFWTVKADINRADLLATTHPYLAAIKNVHLPLAFAGQAQQNADGIFLNLSLKSRGPGILAFDDIGLPPFSVSTLTAQVEVNSNHVAVNNIDFTTGTENEPGPRLTGHVNVQYPQPNKEMRLDIDLFGATLNAEDLFYLWPQKIAGQAREQAALYFIAGTARDARLSISTESQPLGQPWKTLSFYHEATFENANVMTHAPLGALTQAYGNLNIKGQVLTINVNKAQLENVSARQGRVIIDYGKPNETHIQTFFDYEGQIEGALTRLIDGDLNLESLRRIGLEDIYGDVNGSVHFDMAIINDGENIL